MRRLRAAPLEADRVYAVHARPVTHRPAVRQGIHRDDAAAADKRLTPDAAELMHTRQRTDRRLILHHDMPANRCAVGKDVAIADGAIVRHVCVCHEDVVVPDQRQPAPARAYPG